MRRVAILIATLCRGCEALAHSGPRRERHCSLGSRVGTTLAADTRQSVSSRQQLSEKLAEQPDRTRAHELPKAAVSSSQSETAAVDNSTPEPSSA